MLSTDRHDNNGVEIKKWAFYLKTRSAMEYLSGGWGQWSLQTRSFL